MKIALINPSYGDKLASFDEMLSRYYHPRELAAALSRYIDEAVWIQGYREEGDYHVDSIQLKLFKAIPFSGGEQAIMAQHVDDDSLTDAIDSTKPDHVHILGLLPMNILRISELAAKYTTSISASFHGGHPSNDPSFFSLQAQALKRLSVLLFNAPERAKVWQEAGLISSSTKVAICPETSTFFKLKDRGQVRSHTGMIGDPVCVASARLHQIKDPFTLLKGFELILKTKPDAHLYWAYQTDELLLQMKAMISTSTQLLNAVHLRGAIDKYEDMEDFFNSADFFLQASLEEYGGNSLVEAMACGALPVVTNIPSFRYLTGDNQFNSLFNTGDAEGLARIVTDLPRNEYPNYMKGIRDHFDVRLSFDTIARTLLNNLNRFQSMSGSPDNTAGKPKTDSA